MAQERVGQVEEWQTPPSLGFFPLPHRPPCPATSTVDLGLKDGNPSSSQVRQELCPPVEPRLLKPRGWVGEEGQDTCPQALGRGVEVEHEGGNGVVHRADPVPGWKHGDA